jgi:GNAT superfamily N-acetyltransferase
VTTGDLHVVRYRRDERDDVFALVAESFSHSDADRLIRQWTWKYEANPFNPDGDPHVLLLKDGRRLAGMYGRLFFRVAIEGQECWAHHGCDLALHPAYRGRGLTTLLTDHDKSDSEIHFSWQNQASYRALWRDQTAGVPFQSLGRPLHVSRVARKSLGDRAFARALAAMAAGAARRRLIARRRRVPSDPVVTRIDSFDERFDRLWKRACRDYPVVLVRDRRYLEWRFTQRPDARYTILAAIRAGEVIGYVVTRQVDRAGERWSYLVDFLVRDRCLSTFAVLVEEVISGHRREGVVALGCRFTAPPFRRMLYRHGFVPLARDPKGYIRARARRPGPVAREFGVNDWFLTMGDGDLEMSL